MAITKNLGPKLLGISTAVLVALTFSLSPAVAAKAAKGPRVKLGNACTLLSASEIGRQFGKPVVVLPDTGLVGKFGCTAEVGVDHTQPPGGIVAANQVYPFITGRSSAQAAIEDERAYSDLAGDAIKDVDNLGQAAYFNSTVGQLVVQATKKLVFYLSWVGAGATKTSAGDLKRLIKVAQGVVARSPR